MRDKNKIMNGKMITKKVYDTILRIAATIVILLGIVFIIILGYKILTGS